jgi:hypothetical protein
MKISLFLFVTVLLFVSSVSAGERTLALTCDPELAARSRAVVVIWPLSDPSAKSRLVVRCGDAPLHFTLYEWEAASLVVRAIHPRLGMHRCAAAMPDWYGDIACGMEGMTVRGSVN